MEHEWAHFPFRVVDLTHPIHPIGPLWPGDPATTRSQNLSVESEHYSLFAWSFGEHTGTHIGAPSHYIEKATTIDQLSVRRLQLPLAIVPLPKRQRKTHNYAITVKDMLRDERRSGRIVPGALVALETGWSARWPEGEKIFARDRKGRFIFPGFSAGAAHWLFEERKVAGLGSDAPGVDPGSDAANSVGVFIARSGGIHLENLAGLERIPVRGAWVIVGALPLVGGTGSPARVLALIPKSQE